MVNFYDAYGINLPAVLPAKDVEKARKIVKWLRISLCVILFGSVLIISIITPKVDKGSSSNKEAGKNIIAASTYYKTSFDCTKAGNYVEKTICMNEDLAKLDLAMNKAYKVKLAKAKNKQKLKTQQKSWVLDTENQCTTERCLSDVLNARVTELSSK